MHLATPALARNDLDMGISSGEQILAVFVSTQNGPQVGGRHAVHGYAKGVDTIERLDI